MFDRMKRRDSRRDSATESSTSSSQNTIPTHTTTPHPTIFDRLKRRDSRPNANPATEVLASHICKLRFPNYDPADDTERATKWLAKLQELQNRKIPLRFEELVNQMVHETLIITSEIAIKSPCESESEAPKRSRGASVDWPDEFDYDCTEGWIREFSVKVRSKSW
ncbi:hypothetical protein CC80DRAFT_546689 [Byssothecium circinans]|uniref:Uncharacterized protein n=1 Tax=Byssothecium circinans TaxID=147558 RepID=A0A6A5UBI9_9PLEO|nr:hypothetical protein CC80DRAFT_546689 [Byssothecium circinans]